MNNLSAMIRDELLCQGADLVGFGNLTELSAEQRHGLPIGVSIAVKYDRHVIRGIHELPTQAYLEQYHALNRKLDMLVTLGADLLRAMGHQAIAQTTAFVAQREIDLRTPLPHKTVATKARIGWIGKCALLVTEKYGSMVRLSSIVTDAPLKTAKPIVGSKCGGCKACVRACPAGAVVGVNWRVGMERNQIFDAAKCRQTARERSMQALHAEITLCGRCIEACPYTKRYLGEAQ